MPQLRLLAQPRGSCTALLPCSDKVGLQLGGQAGSVAAVDLVMSVVLKHQPADMHPAAGSWFPPGPLQYTSQTKGAGHPAATVFKGSALVSRKPHRGWQVGSAVRSDPCRQLFSLGSAYMSTNEARQSIWLWALERHAPAAGGCSPGALPQAPCWPGAALPSQTAGRSSPQSARLPHCRGLQGRH